MLVAKLDEGYDLVCGWRQQRQDKLILAEGAVVGGQPDHPATDRRAITDNGCSLKAYRRDLLDRISLYAEQHRFIPALSASVGARITELPVRHHARRFGESKYGISRTVKVLVGPVHAEDDHDVPVPAAGGLRRSRDAAAGARGPGFAGALGLRGDALRAGQGRRARLPRRRPAVARRRLLLSPCSGWSPRWR